jgi:hypothetical protein
VHRFPTSITRGRPLECRAAGRGVRGRDRRVPPCTHWKAPPCHGAHPKQTHVEESFSLGRKPGRVNSFRQRKSANIPEVPHTALFGSEVAPLGLRYVIGNQNSCGELTWTRLTGRFPSRLCCRSAGAGLSHVLMRVAPGGGRYPCQRDRKKGSGAVHDVAIT